MKAPAPAASARPLWAFALLSALYFGFIGYFNPYLPLWLKELGFGTLAIGVLSSVQSLTRVLAPYGWGWVSDHTGHRVWLMRIASSLAFVCAWGLVATPRWVDPGFAYVAIVLFVMFCNTSAMMPMAEAAMSQMVSRGGTLDVGRYGRVRVWGSIGFIITVVVFGFWFDTRGLDGFAWGAVLLLAGLVATAWRLPAARESTHEGSVAPSLAPVMAQPAVRWFFVSLFFMILAHVALYAFFSLYLDELGYSKRVVGMLWAVSVLVEIVWFLDQGRWLPRWKLSSWMAFACGLACLRFAATAAFGASLVVLVIAQAVHAITFAAHHTVCIAFINRHFPDRLRGRGQALYTVIGYGLSGLAGGVAGGALSEALGFEAVFWAASVIAGIATLAAWQCGRHDTHEGTVAARLGQNQGH